MSYQQTIYNLLDFSCKVVGCDFRVFKGLPLEQLVRFWFSYKCLLFTGRALRPGNDSRFIGVCRSGGVSGGNLHLPCFSLFFIVLQKDTITGGGGGCIRATCAWIFEVFSWFWLCWQCWTWTCIIIIIIDIFILKQIWFNRRNTECFLKSWITKLYIYYIDNRKYEICICISITIHLNFTLFEEFAKLFHRWSVNFLMQKTLSHDVLI